jgi:hypothetical protein
MHSLSHLAGLQHLLDAAKQTIRVFQHDAIKLAALRFSTAGSSYLRVKSDRAIGVFSCGYGVQEAVLLLVPAI